MSERQGKAKIGPGLDKEIKRHLPAWLPALDAADPVAGIGTWSTIYQLTQRQARPPRVRPHKPPALLAERISSTTAPHVTTPPLNGCECKCSVVRWKCSGAPRPLRVVLRQVAILPAAASVLSVRNGMPQFDIQAKSHVHFFAKQFCLHYITV